jgi:hypothetical protein
MPSDDKKKEAGKKMEVIDLTLDLDDDEKSSTSKDIDFNIFAAPIVCPLVYTRGQTNAAIAAAIGAAPVGVLPAAFHGMPAAIQAIQATLLNIQATQVNMQATQANMQATLANMQDDLALANNRGCSSVDHPLRPRQAAGPGPAPLPAHFPPTLSQLLGMSGAAINPFLVHYGLAAGGTLQAKRRRLASFLGVPAHLVP